MLFAYGINRFSHDVAHIKDSISHASSCFPVSADSVDSKPFGDGPRVQDIVDAKPFKGGGSLGTLG